MEKLIIDLRSNPGGYLECAAAIADMLLDKDLVITYTVDRQGRKEELKTKTGGTDVPIVLLINGGSASASEILAGALSAHHRAVMVGEKTFGKGLVQATRILNDGSMLKYTISRYYTPNGVCIDKEGIEPDITVALEIPEHVPMSRLTDKDDNQLERAVAELKEIVK